MPKSTKHRNQALITALGLGVKGDEFDASQLRYHRICLMTDADVDGAHIAVADIFYRYQRSLIEEGYLLPVRRYIKSSADVTITTALRSRTSKVGSKQVP